MPTNQPSTFAKKSIGQKIITKIPTVSPAMTLEEVHSFLHQNIKNFQSINYIYVIDSHKKLLGIFSIKDLYSQSPATKVEKFCQKSPAITVLPQAHQEEVAYLSLKNNLKEVPVVDEQKRLLGVVSHDILAEIIYQELREDILKLSGIHRSHLELDNILEIPIYKALKHRLPWLFLGLIGGLIAAQIISYFENILAKNLILAAFIPLVVYIADAVGTQLEAFTIRDFALFRKIKFFPYFAKQFLVVLIMALLLGGMLTLISFVLHNKLNIALVLGIATVAATLSALISGLLVPFIFRKLKSDPANASGPIGTIIQDILSVLIYFSIAAIIIK